MLIAEGSHMSFSSGGYEKPPEEAARRQEATFPTLVWEYCC